MRGETPVRSRQCDQFWFTLALLSRFDLTCHMPQNTGVRLLTGVSFDGNPSYEVQERYESISLNASRYPHLAQYSAAVFREL